MHVEILGNKDGVVSVNKTDADFLIPTGSEIVGTSQGCCKAEGHLD